MRGKAGCVGPRAWTVPRGAGTRGGVVTSPVEIMPSTGIPFGHGSAGWLECAGGSWNVGPFEDFMIEPTSEAIFVPA